MKKCFFIIAVFLPLMIQAQNLNGRISASLYSFERFDSQSVSETFLRNFETLMLNFNYDNVSLRTRVNFETNFSNSLSEDPRLRFYNLYFEARDVFDVATVKLGRQTLINSMAGGVYDGLNLKLKVSDFAVTGFYGGNVPAYQKLALTSDWNNDFVLGGKIETTALENFHFALSYINKNFKTDSYYATRLDADLNPIQALIEKNSNQYKFVSGEASYDKEGFLSAHARVDYDLNFEEMSKFEFNTRFRASEDFGLNVYYNFREPLINYNSIFSVFNYGSTQEIEGGIDYRLSSSYTAFANFGYVKYEDENSQRISLGVNTAYGSLSYRKSLGYAGELDALSLYAAHTYFEGLLTPSVGIAFTSYKLSKDDDTNSLTTLLAGLNLRTSNALSFDVQGQYLNNKIYKNDFRFLLKINYWFNTNFK